MLKDASVMDSRMLVTAMEDRDINWSRADRSTSRPSDFLAPPAAREIISLVHSSQKETNLSRKESLDDLDLPLSFNGQG
jgi:hypothetical protein